jgi:iron complex transport system ATP-binding protein
MKAAVTVEAITVGYGKETVLHELTFRVEAGEFFVVCGPNGSGKSTLLKAVAGLLRPLSGTVRLFGRDVASFGKRELARLVAHVPQFVPLDFPFTVAEVVLMGRSPHLGLFGLEGKSDMEKAREAMERTRVAHLETRTVDRLSGGERQRVFLAQALCQEPRILLLDEPTAALDLSHQVNFMDILEDLRSDQNLTIAMVSHDLNLAAMYGERALLLKAGRAVASGPPGEIFTFASLEETYGCVVVVSVNPLGGFPQVTPVPRRYLRAKVGR